MFVSLALYKGVYLACITGRDNNELVILLLLPSLGLIEVDWGCLALQRSWFVKVVKSFRSSCQFISAGVGIKDGPFASKDILGDVKFRQDKFIAFWLGTLSLARAILCLLLFLFLLHSFFFFTDILSFEKCLFLDRFLEYFCYVSLSYLLKVFGSVFV